VVTSWPVSIRTPSEGSTSRLVTRNNSNVSSQ
jgi:hypothetical protein